MSDITPDLIKQLASLSKIHFSEEEVAALMVDLDKVLSYMEQLSGIDVSGVEEFITLLHSHSADREDDPETSLSREDLLKNAPQHTGGMIRVPAVFGE